MPPHRHAQVTYSNKRGEERTVGTTPPLLTLMPFTHLATDGRFKSAKSVRRAKPLPFVGARKGAVGYSWPDPLHKDDICRRRDKSPAGATERSREPTRLPRLALTGALVRTGLGRVGEDRPARRPAAGPLQPGAKAVLRPAADKREVSKVVVIASARKLLTILNAMVRERTKWDASRLHKQVDIHHSCLSVAS